MNWKDDNDDVIEILNLTPPLHHRSKIHMRGKFSASPSSDVIVLTDNEDEHDAKGPLGSVKRILIDTQTNLPAPIPGPSALAVSYDAFILRVLEIIPDVEPDHLRGLLEQQYPAHGENVVENVLHMLFEDTSYPRMERDSGKRKRATSDEDGPDSSKLKIDYASKDREFAGGHNYFDQAFSQLLVDFPFIPKPHIRTSLFVNKRLYAPTYLFLTQEAQSDHLPYKKKTLPSRVAGKGKQLHDAEFEKERAWLVDHVKAKVGVDVEDEANDDECENGIECGCCFSSFAFDKMIQCPEAHLFCRMCCCAYAANQLGQHDHRLHCMDQSGCKELFPESELARFLPMTLLALYHRLKQQKEVASAGLEGLEECPFCEYKVVIENPDEKLFRCENADCGVVSCRSCKKVDHLPKNCKEAEEDKHLSVRHAIEEAMTKALMRNCPKCQKGFVKEHGCNKMTCPNCGTLSCYICRQIIVGYDHFGSPPPYTGPINPNKCKLWDPVEQRHDSEVIAAAKKAVEEYKRLHPDVSDEALNVDIPSPARKPPAAAGPVAGQIYNLQAMQAQNHQLRNAWLAQPVVRPPLPVVPPARRQAAWAPLVPPIAPAPPGRRRR